MPESLPIDKPTEFRHCARCGKRGWCELFVVGTDWRFKWLCPKCQP